MRSGRRGALGWTCALALAACAAPGPRDVDFSETTRGIDPNSYDQIRAAWTRHAKVVEDVGTVIEVWGIYKGWEFREAYVARYAKAYSLPEPERKALYDSQMEAAKRTYEFHVAAQTTNFTWNDLERPTTAWRVSLLDGAGGEIAPVKIEVPKLPELYESQFFPNRTEFSRTYLIRFDRVEAEAAGFAGPRSGRLTLRVVSPMARAELAWKAK
jgi:hypothetical protein